MNTKEKRKLFGILATGFGLALLPGSMLYLCGADENTMGVIGKILLPVILCGVYYCESKRYS